MSATDPGAPPADVAADLAGQFLAISLDGLAAFGSDLRCRYWNPTMERMLGMAAVEAMGKAAPDLLPFLGDQRELSALRRALGGEEIAAHEQPFAIAGAGAGGRGFCQARYTPWRSDGGDPIGVIAILRDVTAAREVEQRAQETEARFKVMADAAPVLLWMADRDALCTFFNQTWLTFTGRTLEQEWGVGWAEGVHFEDLQPCLDMYMAAFRERRVFEMEYRLRRADGEFRWILDRGTPRFGSDGQFAGYIGSCIDITDRKNLEFELRSSVRVRDEFLSIASHELRTPLAAMQLQVENLDRMVQKRGAEHLANGRLVADLERTSGHVRRMTKLVETLLDISRLSEGRLDLDRKQMDLVALIQDVARSMRTAASAAGCELSLTAPGVAAGEWDRLRLEQVLTNLVANAIKFGAGKPIDVLVTGDEQTALVAVIDRGIGIAREQQRRIFERFERGVSARHFGGFGLGLWISRQIVEAHGGHIRVDSRPGQGATFTLELPRGGSGEE
ncbi:MAG TPA: PAS domain-containing sensor histidine kinase [Polyangia bacterium]|nr:PAS domain-containing sensor histidine kinase [Polyangia bacterium]